MTKTRIPKDGFREAECPLCGLWVRVTSLEDDTRWRFGTHKTGSENCGSSGELLAAPRPAPTSEPNPAEVERMTRLIHAAHVEYMHRLTGWDQMGQAGHEVYATLARAVIADREKDKAESTVGATP